MGAWGDDSASKKSNKIADESYKLQREMFEFEKAQIKKLEQDKANEEAQKAADIYRQIQGRATGRNKLITTREARQGFNEFKSDYEKANPFTFQPSDELKALEAQKAKETKTWEEPAGVARTFSDFAKGIKTPTGSTVIKSNAEEINARYNPQINSLRARLMAEQMTIYRNKMLTAYSKIPGITKKPLTRPGERIVKKELR